jgi:UDP-glucose 4-epimerase
MASVLLTGGSGYIGIHTAVELIQAGHTVVIMDNLSNSCRLAVTRAEQITGERIRFYEGDAADYNAVEKVFVENKLDAVIHFAGLKAVGESVREPLKYYQNNLGSLMTVAAAMERHNVGVMIYSSSATVYGEKNPIPYTETMPAAACTNPYGWTKYMCEQILQDACRANDQLSVMLLRYFNPIGAHPSGRIGESPNGIPNNLMPYIAQVAVGRLDYLRVFGDDYDTPDGTGVRDYIHVVDLARGHVAALEHALHQTGVEIINLGTGRGYSVLDLVRTFEAVNNIKVPYKIVDRRPGDLAEYYADASKAKRVLGWTAEFGIEEMCRDVWNWQSNNPNGYTEE